MPHQCTDCGTVFDDGSTEMLSGCPECGGNTFQFLPGSQSSPPPESPPEPESHPPERHTTTDSVANSVGSAAKTVRDIVSGTPDSPGTDPESADPLSRPDDGSTDPSIGTGQAVAEEPRAEKSTPSIGSEENAAQASARSDVVSTDELPPTDGPGVAVGSNPPQQSASKTTATGERDRPDLETLREELNDQFESIRIVEPGQYELNLMELYEREEYIIALQEDGRYRIQVPESW